MRYAIGLDVGIASVGYAVVELNEKDLPYKIHKLGSRIFESAEIEILVYDLTIYDEPF